MNRRKKIFGLPFLAVGLLALSVHAARSETFPFDRPVAADHLSKALPYYYETFQFRLGNLRFRKQVKARKPLSVDKCPDIPLDRAMIDLVTYPDLFNHLYAAEFLQAGLVDGIHKTGLLGTANQLLVPNPTYSLTCDYGFSITGSVDHLITAKTFVKGSKTAVLAVTAISYSRKLVGVTGIISPLRHLKQVEFAYVNAPTLFGRMLKPGQIGFRKRSPQSGRAEFVLYDDGWRLKQIWFGSSLASRRSRTPFVPAQGTKSNSEPAKPSPLDKRKIRQLTIAYGISIQKRIETYRSYPPEALKRGQSGKSVFKLVVDKTGALLSAKLSRSAGHSALDDASLRAIFRAAPFPPFPDGIPNERITFTLPFDYRR